MLSPPQTSLAVTIRKKLPCVALLIIENTAFRGRKMALPTFLIPELYIEAITSTVEPLLRPKIKEKYTRVHSIFKFIPKTSQRNKIKNGVFITPFFMV